MKESVWRGSSCRFCGHLHGDDPEGWCIRCGKSYAGSAKFCRETESLSPRMRIEATLVAAGFSRPARMNMLGRLFVRLMFSKEQPTTQTGLNPKARL